MAGLLALMLLTDARRAARSGPDGTPIPMSEQDRGRWNADQIAEGVTLITAALPRGPTGPYQLQAAIAAVHDEAPSAETTDWPQILALRPRRPPVHRPSIVVVSQCVRGERTAT